MENIIKAGIVLFIIGILTLGIGMSVKEYQANNFVDECEEMSDNLCIQYKCKYKRMNNDTIKGNLVRDREEITNGNLLCEVKG